MGKRGLGLGELHVGKPEFFRAPVRHIAAQYVTAFTEPRPPPPVNHFFQLHFANPSASKSILTSNAPAAREFLSRSHPRAAPQLPVAVFAFGSWPRSSRALLDPFLEPFMHGLLFLFPLRTPSEKKYFLTTRSRTQAHLQAFISVSSR
jgi:hypothetical protein